MKTLAGPGLIEIGCEDLVLGYNKERVKGGQTSWNIFYTYAFYTSILVIKCGGLDLINQYWQFFYKHKVQLGSALMIFTF